MADAIRVTQAGCSTVIGKDRLSGLCNRIVSFLAPERVRVCLQACGPNEKESRHSADVLLSPHDWTA